MNISRLYAVGPVLPGSEAFGHGHVMCSRGRERGLLPHSCMAREKDRTSLKPHLMVRDQQEREAGIRKVAGWSETDDRTNRCQLLLQKDERGLVKLERDGNTRKRCLKSIQHPHHFSISLSTSMSCTVHLFFFPSVFLWLWSFIVSLTRFIWLAERARSRDGRGWWRSTVGWLTLKSMTPEADGCHNRILHWTAVARKYWTLCQRTEEIFWNLPFCKHQKEYKMSWDFGDELFCNSACLRDGFVPVCLVPLKKHKVKTSKK